jgi:spermidine dehydrogenase
MAKTDRDLGMHRPITRRDFINGTAMALAGAAVGAAVPTREVLGVPAASLDPYPPGLTGMRGSGYPGAYTTGHALRDGTFWGDAPAPVETPDRYDLIIVGAGISGLAAAYFFQKRNGFGTTNFAAAVTCASRMPAASTSTPEATAAHFSAKSTATLE